MKLNKSQIKQLPIGRSRHIVKLTRLHYPESHSVVEFFGEAEVYIQRREKAYKKLPAGEIVVITAGNSWAEGTEKDIEENGSIVVENYLMEIYD